MEYKFKSEYQSYNTVSQTEAANLLGCLLAKVKRMIKGGTLELINVDGSRYERVPIEQVVKLLREELQTITMRSNTIKNALVNLQTKIENGDIPGVTRAIKPTHDIYKLSYLNDPRNAELV